MGVYGIDLFKHHIAKIAQSPHPRGPPRLLTPPRTIHPPRVGRGWTSAGAHQRAADTLNQRYLHLLTHSQNSQPCAIAPALLCQPFCNSNRQLRFHSQIPYPNCLSNFQLPRCDRLNSGCRFLRLPSPESFDHADNLLVTPTESYLIS